MEPPDVLYQDVSEWSESDLRSKCRGIRVFYFNDSCKHRDHQHPPDGGWASEDKNGGGRRLEAGTVIDLTEFDKRGAKEYMLVIQWDCGMCKGYAKEEWICLRVFDLGPTGKDFEDLNAMLN